MAAAWREKKDSAEIKVEINECNVKMNCKIE